MSALGPSKFFPPADAAGEEGLLCIGGQLSPTWLLDAYRHGIFPWPILEDEELLAWFSPDPRAIFEWDQFHVSRRLRRTCRSNRFRVTFDEAFEAVMHGCGVAQDRQEATWITPDMMSGYCQLHQLGWAHSVEVWHDGKLAGGVYGVSIGGLFAAESMFYEVRDASKVALVYLVEHLQARGYVLFDMQELTDHTESMGASEISRSEYMERLAEAISLSTTFGEPLGGAS